MSYKDEAAVWDVHPGHKLNTTQRLVLMFLAKSRNGKTGKCCPSDDLIAEKIGVDERTSRRARVALRKAGLISWVSKGNGSGGKINYYTLHLDAVPQKSRPDISVRSDEGEGNCPQSPQVDDTRADIQGHPSGHLGPSERTPVSGEYGRNKEVIRKRNSNSPPQGGEPSLLSAEDEDVRVDQWIEPQREFLEGDALENYDDIDTEAAAANQVDRFLSMNLDRGKKPPSFWAKLWKGFKRHNVETQWGTDGKRIGIDGV